MQFNRKTLRFLLLNILFVFTAKYSLAQYPGMGAVYSNMNKQFMNQQMNMQMMMMSHYGTSDALYSRKYDFVVVLADGTKKIVYSKIYTDTVLHKDYLLSEDKSLPKSDTNRKRRIFAYQTQSISRDIEPHLISIGNNKQPTTPPVYFFGFPKDSCWMFKVITGPISVYSYLSEEKDTQYFSTQAFVGLQFNDDAIIGFTEENLKKLLSGDKDAMKKFDRKNYYNAILKFNKDFEKASKTKIPVAGD